MDKKIYNIQQNLILLEKQLVEKLTWVNININKCREDMIDVEEYMEKFKEIKEQIDKILNGGK